MSGFDDEWSTPDDVFASVEEAYIENPGEVTARLIEEASRDQFERLQPAIDTVIQGHRQRLRETNSAEAVKAMDDLYGDAWRAYKPAVDEYIAANSDMIEAVIDDPQRLAERLQSAYRTIRPQVDAENATGTWERVKSSYREYGDSIGKS